MAHVVFRQGLYNNYLNTLDILNERERYFKISFKNDILNKMLNFKGEMWMERWSNKNEKWNCKPNEISRTGKYSDYNEELAG